MYFCLFVFSVISSTPVPEPKQKRVVLGKLAVINSHKKIMPLIKSKHVQHSYHFLFTIILSPFNTSFVCFFFSREHYFPMRDGFFVFIPWCCTALLQNSPSKSLLACKKALLYLQTALLLSDSLMLVQMSCSLLLWTQAFSCKTLEILEGEQYKICAWKQRKLLWVLTDAILIKGSNDVPTVLSESLIVNDCLPHVLSN